MPLVLDLDFLFTKFDFELLVIGDYLVFAFPHIYILYICAETEVTMLQVFDISTVFAWKEMCSTYLAFWLSLQPC